MISAISSYIFAVCFQKECALKCVFVLSITESYHHSCTVHSLGKQKSVIGSDLIGAFLIARTEHLGGVSYFMCQTEDSFPDEALLLK